jgi:hypothetical protein
MMNGKLIAFIERRLRGGEGMGQQPAHPPRRKVMSDFGFAPQYRCVICERTDFESETELFAHCKKCRIENSPQLMRNRVHYVMGELEGLLSYCDEIEDLLHKKSSSQSEEK